MKALTIALSLGLFLSVGSANAWQLVSYAGQNPSGATNCVSDPTLVSRKSWDSYDLITSNQTYMNSIAYGPGCASVGGCVLLLPEVALDWLVNYPYHRRYQWLNVFLGGSYTMSTAARLMADGSATTPLYNSTVTGLAAPARCSER